MPAKRVVLTVGVCLKRVVIYFLIKEVIIYELDTK